MNKLIFKAVLIFVILSCVSCKKIDIETTKKEKIRNYSAFVINQNVNKIKKQKQDAINKFINNLSIEEKVSQLFIANLVGDTVFFPVEKIGDIYGNKNTGKPLIPGGYLFFSYNLQDNSKGIINFTDSIKSYCIKQNQVPPFLAIDQEGGLVNRLKVVSGPLPSSQRIVENLTKQNAYKLYSFQAMQMNALGFHMNIAPVVEICTEENKNFLNGRSFGSFENVINYGLSFINGFENNNISCVLKHFPGNTNTDPHSGLPEINWNQEQMENMIKPFELLLKYNPEAVLMSHAKTSLIDKNVPSCLSSVWVTDYLRNKYKFDGIIFSDDIFMAALTNLGYPPEKASVKAIEVGIDCIMISEKRFASAAFAIIDKAKKDSDFEQKVYNAVKKIINYKIKNNILVFTQKDEELVLSINDKFDLIQERINKFNDARQMNIQLYLDYF